MGFGVAADDDAGAFWIQEANVIPLASEVDADLGFCARFDGCGILYGAGSAFRSKSPKLLGDPSGYPGVEKWTSHPICPARPEVRLFLGVVKPKPMG